MIELLIVACLPSGLECRNFLLLFDAREISIITCMLHGQSAIAPWQQDHPDWKVQRWTCHQPARREVSL